ncbi:MAG: hypothetical protein LBN08_04370 [Lactobacillales bacterium]|jgi:Rgg/GadR/MutR family transcriptional activator|nr:hypothetical protein [Lactobacillales bacterium]
MLGEHFKKYRLNARVSQHYFEPFGISQSTVSHFELTNDVKLSIFANLLQSLGLSYFEFFAERNEDGLLNFADDLAHLYRKRDIDGLINLKSEITKHNLTSHQNKVLISMLNFLLHNLDSKFPFSAKDNTTINNSLVNFNSFSSRFELFILGNCISTINQELSSNYCSLLLNLIRNNECVPFKRQLSLKVLFNLVVCFLDAKDMDQASFLIEEIAKNLHDVDFLIKIKLQAVKAIIFQLRGDFNNYSILKYETILTLSKYCSAATTAENEQIFNYAESLTGAEPNWHFSQWLDIITL